ncbi:hypothetical protein [Enterococcus sp. LJL51]|uniref:hypothetical protein n=1 Tax=Enterococcus sp. LJL51 TaxID=3416656 RepID=UPI003CE6EB49
MNTQINPKLEQQITEALIDAYHAYYDKNETYTQLSEKISSEMGSFYMNEFSNLAYKDTRVFSFTLGEKSFIGYLLWSKELEIYGTESGRFFILLTGFGFISGVEIVNNGEAKVTIWKDLTGEKTVEELLASLKDIHKKADFTAENPLIQKYIDILHTL